MIPYNLILFTALLFLLFLYVCVTSKSDVSFTQGHIKKANLKSINTMNEVVPYSNAIKNNDVFNSTTNKMELLKSEKINEPNIEIKLKKCKQQLRRSIKTLAYISLMESDELISIDRLKDLLNLKENVEYEVLRVSKRIALYQSQMVESIAA